MRDSSDQMVSVQQPGDGSALDSLLPARNTVSPDGRASTDVESVINGVFGSLNLSSRPPRFAMGDMIPIDEMEEGMATLEASPEWNTLLPHIRRIAHTEQVPFSATSAWFVPRMHRRQTGVIYSVR